jgi:AraC-like DNA-binding protein
MPNWALNTDGLSPPERHLAWQGAMQRLRLSNPDRLSPEAMQGNISWTTSARGTEFAVMQAGPQSLSGREAGQPPGIWVGVVVDGDACLDHDGSLTHLNSDSVLFGPTGARAALRFSTSFRLLLVTIPGRLIECRLVEPLQVGVTSVRQHSGMQRIFLDLLQSTAREIDDLAAFELKHLENACLELLVGSVLLKSPQANEGALQLRHVYQTIEELLDDPDLSIGQIGQKLGRSTRYLQKLFTAGGQTFTAYVLRRRLLRCKNDLQEHGRNRSVSDICFARGFSDAAHFSRSFRREFGMSPREWRAQCKASSALSQIYTHRGY